MPYLLEKTIDSLHLLLDVHVCESNSELILGYGLKQSARGKG